MFDFVEMRKKKIMKNAVELTRYQYLQIIKVLKEIGLPYTTFWNFNSDDSTDDKFIQLSNNTFVVKNYFSDFKIPESYLEE